MDEYSIVAAIQSMEEDLIKSMARNMKRHIGEEQQEGINWNQWQAEMLKGLQQYKAENRDIVSGYYSTIMDEIDATIRQAYASGQTEQEIETLKALKAGYKKDLSRTRMKGVFFKTNERKLNALIESVQSDFSDARKAILRTTDDIYRKAIYQAQVHYNNGAKTVWQAVDMATKNYLSKGIDCIQYKNGARVNIASYAEMALRTANKRANLMGAAASRDARGIHTIIVTAHESACPICVQWQGLVYYDDVYGGAQLSMLDAEERKFPPLSKAVNGGLFHPNCRNGTASYFAGISEKPKPATAEQKAEQVRRYNLEQKQRYYERNIRQCKRLSNGAQDAQTAQMYADRAEQWKTKYRGLISQHSYLLRDNPARLKLYGINSITPPPKITKPLPKMPKTHATPKRKYDTKMSQTFGTKHYDKLQDMLDKCENSKMREVWKKNEQNILIGNNGKHAGGAKCKGNTIFVDIDKCAQGDRISTAYQTVFHESGHAIDNLTKMNMKGSSFGNHFSSAYQNGIFPQTIEKEVKALVDARNSQLKAEFAAYADDMQWFIDNKFAYSWNKEPPKYSKKFAYESIEREMYGKDSIAVSDLCDMLEGATNGKISCVAGHGKQYWKDRKMGDLNDGLAAEAFAEMTSALIASPESLKTIKQYLPESYKIFEKMLEVILNG